MIISRHEMSRKGNEIWAKNFLCKLSNFQVASGEVEVGFQSCQLKHDENIIKGVDEEYRNMTRITVHHCESENLKLI